MKHGRKNFAKAQATFGKTHRGARWRWIFDGAGQSAARRFRVEPCAPQATATHMLHGSATGDSDSYIRRFHEAFPPSRAAATHLTFFERKVSDLKSFVMDQDVIYVGGGSSANLLAVWRLHGLDRVLRAAWNAGVVMAGISAGAICWFEDGLTDSFGMPYRALNDGLGFVRGACCPHYDGEKERRPALLRLIKRGFPPTLALDDGAAVHFEGMRFAEAVSSRPEARVYRVRLVGGKVVQSPIPMRYLGKS